MRHHLLVARWERTLFPTQEMDFTTTYGATPQGFEQSQRLSACSPQSLMARLLLRRSIEERRALKIMDDLQLHADLWYSFILGPQLPKAEADLANYLRGLFTLPFNYSVDCIYIWSKNSQAAERLKILGQAWECKTATILSSTETARLLALPKGPPIVVISW
jgi:hypothetical protein